MGMTMLADSRDFRNVHSGLATAVTGICLFRAFLNIFDHRKHKEQGGLDVSTTTFKEEA
jgi:hypothetical protein